MADDSISCDTRSGILQYLTLGLEGLNKLRADRDERAYGREGRLHEFCVLGRFWFDASGNCGVIVNHVPAELYRVNPYDPTSSCPIVMTRDEVLLLLRGESLNVEHRLAFPPHNARCHVCGDGWTLDNCHDVLPLDDEDKRRFCHVACLKRVRATQQRKEFLAMFASAGFEPSDVNLITIPNGYGEGQHYAAPWYLAQVGDGGKFRIGWRKRVIEIDWTESGKSLPDLFVDENVTKGGHHIHAWGYGKGAEYLKKLVPLLAETR